MSVFSLQNKTKKVFQKISIIIFIFIFYFSFFYSAYATLYNPGETLEPDCAPTSINCGVSVGSVISGGTGITSYNVGDLLYASASSVLSKLGIGTNGQVLKISGGLPVWGTAGSNIGDSDLTLAGPRILTLAGNSLTFHGTGSDIVFNNDGTINGSAQNMTLARIGNSTFSTLQDLQNVFHSAGYTSGGNITDAGGGKVNVAAGTGLLRNSNTATSTIAYMDWTAVNGITIPINSTRYIGIEYNGGSPQVSVRTSSNWNLKTDFSLGVVVNEGGNLSIFSDKQAVGDHAANMVQRDYETMPLEPDVRNGGLVFSETGTRNISLTAGAIWDRLNRYTIPNFNTSISNSFDAYYMNGGGGFTKVTGLTQWPNTKYDDESGTLATLSDGKYGVLWFYLDTNAKISMMYGMGEYDTVGLANSAMELSVDMLPARLSTFGKLIGKIVFQKNASVVANAQSLLGMSVTSGGVTDHAGLSDLDYAHSGHTGFADAIAGVNDNITSATGLTSITPGAALTITSGGSSIWSTSLGALTIDSAATLNLGTTNATSINIGKTGITTINNGNFTLAGNLTIPHTATNLTTTGTINDLDLNAVAGPGTTFYYQGAGDVTYTGIAGGTDGRTIYIVNNTIHNMTFTDNDYASLSGNRIEIPTGNSLTITKDSTVILQYDSVHHHWHMVSYPVNTSTIGGFAFSQGGSAFGATATLGTTDVNTLNFITGGSTRFTLASGATTLTGTGATSITTNNTLSLSSAAGSALNINSGTTGDLNLDSGTTGAINIGTGTSGKVIHVGDGVAINTITIGNGTDDTFSLASSGLNVSSVGALTGVASLTSNGLITTSGNISTTGSGTITSAGLFTASAGLAVSGGTANVNTTGTSNTAIGNSTGTFALTSNGGLNVTTGGALTGVASIDTISTSATALTFAGAGTVDTTSAALALGTSGATSVSLGKSGITTINNGALTTSQLLTGNLGLTVSGGAISLNDSSNFNISLAGGNSTGTVNIGTGTGIQALHFGDGGTGAKTLTIGSNASTGTTTIQAGTGSILLGGQTTGTSATFVRLPVKTDSGDPTTTQTNGAMYYNSNSNVFRCYENGSWKNCDTTGGTATMQQSYNAGSTITTSGANDLALTLTSGNFTATGAGAINLTPTTASSFTSGGALTLTAGTASTWGTSSGNLNISVAGSGTGNVQIGTGGAGSATPDLFVLDTKSAGSGSGDPVGGTNGATYYNTSSNKFRCYENGSWKNCDTANAGVVNSINGQSDASQTLVVGTAGTDFNISSASGVHTFNIPDASATNRGLITTGTQTIAGAKTFSGNTIISGAATFTTGTGLTTINSTAVNLSGNSTVLDMAGTGILGLNTTTNRAISTGTGMFTTGGNLTISGGKIFMNTNTSGNILVADGTNFNSVASSGDATISSFGGITIGTGAITSGKILDGTIANVDISGSAAIDYSKLNLASSIVNGDIVNGTISNAKLTNSTISLSLGISGSDANVSGSPASLGGTLTLNLPDASATNRGLITTGTQTIAGAKTFSGNNIYTGNFATPKGTDYSTTGLQNDVNLGTGSYFLYTGAGTATFTGITGGTDGREIRITNTSASNLTITNQDAGSVAANRIITPSGINITLAQNVSAGFQYDASVSRWRVVTIPASVSSISGFAFLQSGNAFGAAASIGTTDANSLNFITGGATRFTVAAASNTLTGNGATSITTSSGALTLDATTVANLGTSTATSVSIGRSGITTTNNGALSSTQTITASNGLTLTTGALNLTATSGTVDLHSITIANASPLVFDGTTTDANKTTFAITDPTGARTITFPDASITVNAAANISGTTLASNVVTSSLTTVGALSSGSIASGFGSIATTNNITTSGNISTTGSGTMTSAGTLTASNGLTLSSGSLILPTASIADSAHSSNVMLLNGVQIVNGAKTFNNSKFVLAGSTSGTSTLNAAAIAGSTTFTLPGTSGTIIASGDTGTVSSTMIADSTIANADLASGAFSNITGVGILTSGSIASGFGTIATANTISTSSSVSTTGTGTITAAGLLTGSAGLTVSGAAISLNDSSNFNISLAGGNSTGTINIGTGTGIQTLHFGDGNTGAKTVTVGSTSSTSSLTLNASGDNTSSGALFMKGLAATTAGNLVVCVLQSTGKLFYGSSNTACNGSSERYKYNIENISLGLDAIEALRPVSFLYKSNNEPALGFIAEEAAKIDERLVVRNTEGQIDAINPDYFIPILTKGIQEQQILIGDISPKINVYGADNGLSTLVATIQNEKAHDPIVIIGEKISEDKQFLTDFVSARVTAIRGYFDEVFAKKIHTEDICVKKLDGSEVCVNGDQVQTLLNNTNVISNPTSNLTIPAQTPPSTPEQTSTTTPTPTSTSDPTLPVLVSTPIIPSDLIFPPTRDPTYSPQQPSDFTSTPDIIPMSNSISP